MTHLRFIAAAIVAVGYSLLFFWKPWSKPWKRAKWAWYLWQDSRNTMSVPFHRFHDRMSDCRRCEIYYKPLRTCGSPLTKKPWLGCWCYVPLKNKMSSATCWARDKNMASVPGWREGL